MVFELAFVLSALSFVVVHGWTYGRAGVHLAAGGWRRARGRAPGWDRWRLAPLLVLPWSALMLVVAKLDLARELTFTLLWSALVLTPPALALLRRHLVASGGSWAWAVLAACALPFAMAMATVGVAVPVLGVDAGAGLIAPALFAIDASPGACTSTLMQALGMPVATAASAGGGEGPAEAMLLTGFWLDSMAKAALADTLEVYGCSLSTLRHQPEALGLTTLVFVFRTFVSAVVIAVVAQPVLAWLARRRAAAAAGPRA